MARFLNALVVGVFVFVALTVLHVDAAQEAGDFLVAAGQWLEQF